MKKKSENPKRIRVNVTLDRELIAKLDRLAKQEDRSRSDVLRRLLKSA